MKLCTQNFVSMARAGTGFNRKQWNRCYQHQCQFMFSLAVKEYTDRFEVLLAGDHRHSHHESNLKGILGVKQRNAVINAAKRSLTSKHSILESGWEVITTVAGLLAG